MGAEPWSYFVPFQKDVQAALEALREKEFRAGRYHGPHDYDPSVRKPGSIVELMRQLEEAEFADGTRSILDMMTISDTPDFCTVSPLSSGELLALYGTDKPTHQMIEQNMEFYESIERGQGIYIIVYEGDNPSELFFAGYSFD